MPYRIYLLFISGLCTVLTIQGQNKKYDLFGLAQSGGLQVQNRTITPLQEAAIQGVRFSAKEGDGIAWLNGINFSDGIIEADIRGKDVLQQS